MIKMLKKLFTQRHVPLYRMSVNDYFDIEGIPQFKNQNHYEPKEKK